MDDVVWTQRARSSLNDIGEYIAEDDTVAAERTVRRIVEQVSGLAFYPRIRHGAQRWPGWNSMP